MYIVKKKYIYIDINIYVYIYAYLNIYRYRYRYRYSKLSNLPCAHDISPHLFTKTQKTVMIVALSLGNVGRPDIGGEMWPCHVEEILHHGFGK